MSDTIKIRITATIVREVEVNPIWYDEHERSPEQIIAFECEAAKNSPEYFNECESMEVTGEVING